MAKGNPAIQVRANDESRARWEAAAHRDGKNLLDWIRDALDDAAVPKGKRSRAPRVHAPEPLDAVATRGSKISTGSGKGFRGPDFKDKHR